jgi:cell shape-determining protein MreD
MDFFPLLYDNIISNPDFANALYDSGVYNTVGMTMLISSLIFMILYYYVVSNYSNFKKFYFWGIWILVLAIINFSVAYYFSELQMQKQFNDDPPFSIADYINFSFLNFIWTIVIGFILSIPLKTKSTRASKTPF